MDECGTLPLENSHTKKFSQSRTKSFLERRKSSINFREGKRKSTLNNPIAFSQTSIMTLVSRDFLILHDSIRLKSS